MASACGGGGTSWLSCSLLASSGLTWPRRRRVVVTPPPCVVGVRMNSRGAPLSGLRPGPGYRQSRRASRRLHLAEGRARSCQRPAHRRPAPQPSCRSCWRPGAKWRPGWSCWREWRERRCGNRFVLPCAGCCSIEGATAGAAWGASGCRRLWIEVAEKRLAERQRAGGSACRFAKPRTEDSRHPARTWPARASSTGAGASIRRS